MEASWRRSGASWGRLGGLLATKMARWPEKAHDRKKNKNPKLFGDALGRLGSVLGAPWGGLGAAWGHLGGDSEASWVSWRRLKVILLANWRRLGRLGGVLEAWSKTDKS